MELPELPECPVCLQPYDEVSTTPRVLSRGHSVCEDCLTQLPNPFAQTIRCPACTQLVKYPHPLGPLALPKNIDLLRISSCLQNPKSDIPPKPGKPKRESASKNELFLPNLWPYEFYLEWKDWVVPSDAVSVETGGDDDGICSVLYGRILGCSGSLGKQMRCLLKENQKVSLVRVGSFSCEDDNSRFCYSYVAKIMRVLYGMRNGERSELDLILRVSLKQSRICKVYGLWYNSGDRCVYLLCERYTLGLLREWDGFNGSVGEGNEEMSSGTGDNMARFAMLSMEICEAVYSLHLEGLHAGCFALSCFMLNDFGRIYIDFNEVLMMGRRVHRTVAEVILGKRKIDDKQLKVSIKNDAIKANAFISPELLFELLQKEGVDLGSVNSRYVVGCGSDVWSIACVLLWLLIGNPIIEEMHNYLSSIVHLANVEDSSDYQRLYMCWMDKVSTLLETRLGSEFPALKEILCNSLNCDQGSRPVVSDLWTCIRKLMIEPKFDMMLSLDHTITEVNTFHCMVLGELCELLKETKRESERQIIVGLQEKDENGVKEGDQVGEPTVDRELIDGLSGDHVKCIDLKGHLDCITGLAVGGGFLFSSSFDKTVNVWSLQDFTNVHSFKGHEHRVMAVVYVDEEQPLCISGDYGGGIFIWGISTPFSQEPVKKLYEQKDWRYSGIHALSISGIGYLYTGSGDKSIKAWSLKDYTLSSTMTGHKSVVSTLTVCNGVLYSGSWDGTIRLWCLSDHSPLAVLGEGAPGNVTSVLSLVVDQHVLIVAHENGCIKIWSNAALLKSLQAHNGAIFSVSMDRKWLFTGGLDKTINVQELLEDESEIDAMSVGSIPSDSVITSLLYWQGKLFVGQADKIVKVYYYRA